MWKWARAVLVGFSTFVRAWWLVLRLLLMKLLSVRTSVRFCGWLGYHIHDLMDELCSAGWSLRPEVRRLSDGKIEVEWFSRCGLMSLVFDASVGRTQVRWLGHDTVALWKDVCAVGHDGWFVSVDDKCRFVRKVVADAPIPNHDWLMRLAGEIVEWFPLGETACLLAPFDGNDLGLWDERDVVLYGRLVGLMVKRPDVPEEVVVRVLEHKFAWHWDVAILARSVCESRSATTRMVDAVAGAQASWLRARAARDWRCSPERLVGLAQDESYLVVHEALGNPRFPVDRLGELMASDRAEVRARVADSDIVPLEMLEVLADDDQMIVRLAVARNARTSADVLLRLVCDQDERVRQEAGVHPNAPTVVRVLGALS